MVTFLAMVASPENISPMVKHNPSANSVLEISINSIHSPYTIYNLFQKYLNTIIYLIMIERWYYLQYKIEKHHKRKTIK